MYGRQGGLMTIRPVNTEKKEQFYTLQEWIFSQRDVLRKRRAELAQLRAEEVACYSLINVHTPEAKYEDKDFLHGLALEYSLFPDHGFSTTDEAHLRYNAQVAIWLDQIYSAYVKDTFDAVDMLEKQRGATAIAKQLAYATYSSLQGTVTSLLAQERVDTMQSIDSRLVEMQRVWRRDAFVIRAYRRAKQPGNRSVAFQLVVMQEVLLLADLALQDLKQRHSN